MGKAIHAAAIAVLSCSVLVTACARFEPGRTALRGPLAVGGVLDLRGWDFEHKGAVSLAGEWRFASAALLNEAAADAVGDWQVRTVPDFWTRAEGGDRIGTGAGTYRLRILLPADAPPLAVRNFTGFNAFELEANGALVARAGKPALDRAGAVSAYGPGVNPVEPRSGELDLLLRVSNWEYRGGGVWRVLVLGDRAGLAFSQAAAVQGSIALSVLMITLALNSTLLFLFRRKEKSYLFFAIFAFIIALRPLVTGEYSLVRIFPGIPFDLLVRVEYSTAMLGMPSAIAFFLDLFPIPKRRFWSLILLLPFAPFPLFILLLPLRLLTWTIFGFYFVAIAAMLTAIGAVLARAAYVRVQGGLAMFLGGLLIAVCGINDMLYSSHILDTANLLPIALSIFVFLQSAVLAKRFTLAFDKVETLSAELGASNEQLKEQIKKAMAASARLEESLTEKETLLKEVHHRVKNSMQIVSSIVSLQANRSREPEVERMSRSIKERIRVIALANEKLYDLESGDRFELADYARDILGLALSSYESDELRLAGCVSGEKVYAMSSQGIDFGLILTELVANAIKHGLLPKGGGRVEVDIRKEGESVRFEVSDDGPGFSPGFEPEAAQTLGFKIAVALLRRWNGSISVSGGPGARVACSLPLYPSPAKPESYS